MSFDREALARAVAAQGRVARVVVAGVAGSTPREAGAAMLVWEDGQSGTIGGGTLEFEAAARAVGALTEGDRVDRVPLGPALGQCCGGVVTLLTEVWDAARLAAVNGDVLARPLPGAPVEMPLSVARLLARARDRGETIGPGLHGGWMVEPVLRKQRPLWVWGAGHVGRAIVAVLAPLPDLEITWIDTTAERFPQDIPEGVTQLLAASPESLVPHAPHTAEHLILTYSHVLDLELCHRLLDHGFAACGLIGSRSKWARFQGRLRALGHADASISRIRCPIGQPELGKHPQAIAIGVARDILARDGNTMGRRDLAG